MFRQRNKQTSSIGLKALKPRQHFASQSLLRHRGLSSPYIVVFLAGSEFRLRIPVGKLLTVQEGAAGEARFAKQSDENSFSKPFRGIKTTLYTVPIVYHFYFLHQGGHAPAFPAENQFLSFTSSRAAASVVSVTSLPPISLATSCTEPS